MYRSSRMVLAVAGALLVVAGWTARPAMAFPRYNDGCQSCHGAFTDDTSPKGTVFPSDSKHEMHRAAANMDTACNLCHTNGDGRDPFLGSSQGTANNVGYGCSGCHGRDYGGALGVRSVGLRTHHATAGVTLCAICHNGTQAPADPATPLPEDVFPPYYGTVDTNADFPCNSAGSTGTGVDENWTIGDTLGLDNDGDDKYDQNDPDCAGSPCVCGDFNVPSPDGAVNLLDFAQFSLCFGGQTSVPGCECTDMNQDGAINLFDFATFGIIFGGAASGSPPNCS